LFTGSSENVTQADSKINKNDIITQLKNFMKNSCDITSYLKAILLSYCHTNKKPIPTFKGGNGLVFYSLPFRPSSRFRILCKDQPE